MEQENASHQISFFGALRYVTKEGQTKTHLLDFQLKGEQYHSISECLEDLVSSRGIMELQGIEALEDSKTILVGTAYSPEGPRLVHKAVGAEIFEIEAITEESAAEIADVSPALGEFAKQNPFAFAVACQVVSIFANQNMDDLQSLIPMIALSAAMASARHH